MMLLKRNNSSMYHFFRRRRNTGLEDTFDIMGNDISHAPSKYQAKKEKKAARKNRKNRRQKINENHATISKKNDIIEDNNGSTLESEESENADIEDNVEMQSSLPAIGESDYSSGKQSTLASPVPSTDHETNADETTNQVVFTKYPILKPAINAVLMQPQGASQNTADLIQSNSSLMEVQRLTVASKIERSKIPEAETDDQPEVSLSSSLAERPGDSSNTTTSTGIAGHYLPNLTRTEDSEVENDRPLPRVDLNQKIVQHDKNDIEHSCQIHSSKTRITETARNQSCNDIINDVTLEISRIGINDNSHQSPIRYSTNEGECSIQSCLNQFTALELLSGSNKVGCETCTARENKVKKDCKMVYTPSTKQYLISKVPVVLILHLKRFQTQREDFRKVTKHVSFPMTFDLAPVCRNHKRSRIYALYGVVMHSGSIHGGHYVAYVKSRQPLASDDHRWSFLPSRDVSSIDEDSNSANSDSEAEGAASKSASTAEPPPGKWYYVSDSRVTEVDEATVLQSQAYLLFYERIV